MLEFIPDGGEDDLIISGGVPFGFGRVQRLSPMDESMDTGNSHAMYAWDMGIALWMSKSIERYQPYWGISGNFGFGLGKDQMIVDEEGNESLPFMSYFQLYYGARYFVSDHFGFNGRIGWGRMNLISNDSGNLKTGFIELTLGITFDL